MSNFSGLCLGVALSLSAGVVLAQQPSAPPPSEAQQQQQRQITQPGNNAPVWRDVRSGQENYTSIKGRETGVDGVSALYEIGCTATLRQVARHDDGRFDVAAVGAQRFRLLGLDHSRPYLRGEIELLAEETGDEAVAALAAQAVQRSFRGYLDALATQGAARIDVPDLPDEPVLLSYLVAASMIVDLSDRQVMLAEPDAASRLAAMKWSTSNASLVAACAVSSSDTSPRH